MEQQDKNSAEVPGQEGVQVRKPHCLMLWDVMSVGCKQSKEGNTTNEELEESVSITFTDIACLQAPALPAEDRAPGISTFPGRTLTFESRTSFNHLPNAALLLTNAMRGLSRNNHVQRSIVLHLPCMNEFRPAVPLLIATIYPDILGEYV